MAGRYSLQSYTQLKGREIFFDANIILYLYWPTGDMSWMNKYSTLYNLLLKQGNSMYINFLVVSEVVNRAMRLEHDKYKKTKNSEIGYKKYRDSNDGVEALSDIYIVLKNDILSHFDIVDDGYDKSTVVKFLNVDNLDFGDKAIEKICSNREMVLLTNDADFRDSKIDVLSINKKLLR